MTSRRMDRRRFLGLGLSGLGLFAAGGALRYQSLFADTPASAPFASLESIGALLPPDENGVMLPPGFTARIVARSSEAPVGLPGYTWHPAPDGGACFAAPDSGWVYVSNSEVKSNGGGVGALRFNSAGELIDAYPILGNTSSNCAGGPTPWGTWLSCEEFDLGQVYECDPLGKQRAQLRQALGSFKHEAVTVDLENQYLYLTEDQPDGGFYRFRPDRPLPYLESGHLEIASVQERADGTHVEWLQIDDPLAITAPTRKQREESAKFAGAEGISIYEGTVYFTTKHDNRVWRYDTNSQKIAVLYDFKTSAEPILSGVDNLVITATGDVIVAEDGGDMQLVVLTPNHRIVPLVQLIGHARSEMTGPAFDPGYQRLYFSSQRGTINDNNGGITYEVSYTG